MTNKNRNVVKSAGAAIASIWFSTHLFAADNATQRIQAQTEQAQMLAQHDPSGALNGALFLCQDLAAMGRHIMGFYKPLAPTKVFDNLYFVGTEFVGVWVLDTGDGLILFDSMSSSVEAAKYIEGGLAQLGLQPSSIKYVVVTHGHWDHYGGARYLQQKYGARVAMGKADWDLMDKLPEQGPERMGQLAPKQDVVIAGPMDLTLGKTTVKLYPTPGHSPGTTSALLPVREGDQVHRMALWGGTALPPTLEPSHPESDHTWLNLGLRAYQKSLRDFQRWVGEQGADGVISTHPFSENTISRLQLVRERSAQAANPYVLGNKLTQDYFSTLDHCVQAAEIRAENPAAKKP